MERTESKDVKRPSHRVRNVDEGRLDAEAPFELAADGANPERLGRVVAGGDVDWIYEAVRRRFARYLDETAAAAARKPA